MKRRVLSVLFAVLLAVCCLPVSVFARGEVENKLHESHKGVTAGYVEDNYSGIDTWKVTNPMGIENLDPNDPAAEFAFWHFVDSSKQSDQADVTFIDTEGNEVTWTIYPVQNNQHYAVITPVNWILVDGISYSGAAGNFVLSHSGNHEMEVGKVMAVAEVDKYHNEYSPYEKYERDVEKYYERTVDEYYERPVDEYYTRTVDEYYERTKDEYYERDVDEYYERTVDEFYERTKDEYYTRTVDEYYDRTVDEYYERTVDKYFERTAQDVYVRPVYEVYVREAQEYYIPTFAQRVNSFCGTLVTRLTYSDNTKKAVPVNGGVFNNGHTYVAVDVAKASEEGGVWYEIADSSKNNGKKTPDQYNKPIGYKYNVQIRDGKLTISCDDHDFVSSMVGAIVVNDPKKFPGNAPKHYADGVTVDLPAGYGDTVYLYTHFEKVEWYPEPGKYEFVGWEYNNTEYYDYKFDHEETGDYAFKETVYGDDELVDTVYGKYELVNTVYGDYKLKNTVYGDYQLADTQYGDYTLKNTVYGDYELVDTKYGDYEKVNTVYGDYELKNTVYGDYQLADTQYGAYTLKDTVYGKYELVDTQYGKYELVESGNPFVRVSEEYTGGMTLTVNGEVKPLNETFELIPGEYTFVLTSDIGEFEPLTKTVTIVPGNNDTVDFGTIEIQTADVVNETAVTNTDRTPTVHESDKATEKHYDDEEAVKHYADLQATVHESDKDAVRHEADRTAVRHESDKAVEKHYADQEAVRHESDLAAEKHYADLEATEYKTDKEAVEHHSDVKIDDKFEDAEPEDQYIEEYRYRDPIYLGDETDPDGEYAKKLN